MLCNASAERSPFSSTSDNAWETSSSSSSSQSSQHQTQAVKNICEKNSKITSESSRNRHCLQPLYHDALVPRYVCTEHSSGFKSWKPVISSRIRLRKCMRAHHNQHSNDPEMSSVKLKTGMFRPIFSCISSLQKPRDEKRLSPNEISYRGMAPHDIFE